MRIRLDIAYDGTLFSGWARQPGRRTVQGVLEGALATVLREPIALTVAGRTDSGVHATGQVGHADVPASRLAGGDLAGGDLAGGGPAGGDLAAGELARRLRRLLPDDVTVYRARVVPAEFDARFGALRRHYEYRIADRPSAVSPLRRWDTLTWHRPLDDGRMAHAAAGLLGEHDFAAYCRRREGATTVRELQRLQWRREADGVLVCRVSADAFCHNMVRGLVGALIAVGDGRRPPRWPADLLASRHRSGEVAVAPAHGLTLVGVDYPPDDQLAARAAVTRSVRAGCGPR